MEITESFAWSVDYVAEKMRTGRQGGGRGQDDAPDPPSTSEEEYPDKYIVVYFEYAGENDVPPKLDVAVRFVPRLSVVFTSF